jgi:aminocarboxymuconate-semialdehyde decarboxylase
MTASAIDVHHHYVPQGLLDEVKRHGRALGVELSQASDGQVSLSFAGGEKYQLLQELPEIERRLDVMDKGKIGIAVLEAHTASLGYRLDGAKGESWCRLYNEGMQELVKKHPDRFVALAAVPLQDPRRAAAVLEHAVCDLKFCGAYIGSNVNGQYYNSQDFDPFWGKAQELDVLTVMHPEDVAGSERMGPYGLRLICGNPADSALSLGFLAYSGVFDRFPDLKLCVLHGGGFFPYHLGRFDRGFVVRYGARAVQSSSAPSAYLKNLYFDNLVYRVETLEYLKLIAGAERIMVGTDYPYTLGDWMAAEKVDALNCSAAEKEAMLAGNARRLLKLPSARA